MPSLPINKVLPKLQKTLLTEHRLVLQAPPGAGKTTAVPIALLNEPWLNNKQIIILEPRRLAARNAASRMAFLLGEKVGQTVGYQIRQDNCYSKQTKILVITEGILTRKLQADPELENIALVIFDEFHERSLHADLSLALCLQTQQILREDLKILVMSATLDTNAISTLLENAPTIVSQGKSFSVDIHYTEKTLTTSRNNQTQQQDLLNSLFNTVKEVIHNHQGSCLVFLPGVKEINQLGRQITNYLNTENISNISIAPLHGSLNKESQDKAIKKPLSKNRKFVLATNIAETSLTIEGINCVIDSGQERVLQYHPSSGMNRLITQSISMDSATQRGGRAGRLSEGVCYRLWTSQQHKRLMKHSVPEIINSDLSTLMLELANWGVQQPDELQWLDSPPLANVEQAKSLLQQLSALDKDNKITTHGKAILSMGTHPRLAHMMLSAAELNQCYHACLIASLLTEKDIFLQNSHKSSDINKRLQLLDACKHNTLNKNHHVGISLQQCSLVIKSADDFYRRLTQIHASSSTNINSDLTGVLLAYAYPDRIAKQRNKNTARYILSNGKGAIIPEYLQEHFDEYLVIASLDAKQSEANIYLAADITQNQLQTYFPNLIQNTQSVQWNESTQRVESKKITHIEQLTIAESTITPDDFEQVHRCLLDIIRSKGIECLNWSTKANRLKERVRFIRNFIETKETLKVNLQVDDLPDFSNEHLAETLEDWLLPHLNTENSIKQCQKLDMALLLNNQISWALKKTIDKLAPTTITVPSGSSITIDYSDIKQPILAVRLQEVFGLYDTPTLLNGQCQLMMHLLSPARRPMQVTKDLKSFWQTTYHDVKKELRGKYKRHYWPDDPFTAQATNQTKKNMHKNKPQR